MNCREFQDWLQMFLDEPGGDRPADASVHVAECAVCRELWTAADHFLIGLKTLPTVAAAEPSPLLTQSIVAAVLDERRQAVRRARQRIAITLSLAAAILFLMVVGWLNQRPGDDKKMAVQPTPTPELAKGAENARVAVAQLTEKVAAETKEQAKLLMAVANSLDLPPMGELPDLKGFEQPLDPAAQSLRQATETVASGIEPIASSARRAFAFFGEMPVFDLPTKN